MKSTIIAINLYIYTILLFQSIRTKKNSLKSKIAQSSINSPNWSTLINTTSWGFNSPNNDSIPVSANNTNWVPESVYEGKMINGENGRTSAIIPNDWQSGYAADGSFYFKPPNVGDKGSVIITKIPLSDSDLNLSVSQLLLKAANLISNGMSVKVELGPEEFKIDGYKAGRYISSSSSLAKEGYLAGIIVGKDDYVFLGLYDISMKDTFRKGINTVLSSFKINSSNSGSNLNTGLNTENTGFNSVNTNTNGGTGQLSAGCWEYYYGNTDIRTGDVSSQTKIYVDGNGNYKQTSSTAANVPGANSVLSTNETTGRYTINGNVLTVSPSNSQSYTTSINYNNGVLTIGNSKYIPCT